MFRVLVCGGRDYADRDRLFSELDRLLANKLPDVVVIHGDAPGADTLAKEYALARGLEHLPFPADWRAHGRAAGPMRNSRMLAEGRPDACVAFPGGSGTADMAGKAKAAGLPVRRIA